MITFWPGLDTREPLVPPPLLLLLRQPRPRALPSLSDHLNNVTILLLLYVFTAHAVDAYIRGGRRTVIYSSVNGLNGDRGQSHCVCFSHGKERHLWEELLKATLCAHLSRENCCCLNLSYSLNAVSGDRSWLAMLTSCLDAQMETPDIVFPCRAGQCFVVIVCHLWVALHCLGMITQHKALTSFISYEAQFYIRNELQWQDMP